MLPYIATPTKLLDAAKKGLEQWRPPSDPDLSTRREIWMPKALVAEVNKTVWDPVGNETERQTRLRQKDCYTLMTAFLRGDLMEVGAGTDRVEFKALTPPPGQDWRAWELRPTVNHPKTRIFGVLASQQDFLAWSCVPKFGLSDEAQTNLARSAVAQSVTILGQGMLSFNRRPTAEMLGGEDYGWW